MVEDSSTTAAGLINGVTGGEVVGVGTVGGAGSAGAVTSSDKVAAFMAVIRAAGFRGVVILAPCRDVWSEDISGSRFDALRGGQRKVEFGWWACGSGVDIVVEDDDDDMMGVRSLVQRMHLTLRKTSGKWVEQDTLS